MACSFSVPRAKLRSLAGLEHGRTIPLPDINLAGTHNSSSFGLFQNEGLAR
jgi:hypothetical protein